MWTYPGRQSIWFGLAGMNPVFRTGRTAIFGWMLAVAWGCSGDEIAATSPEASRDAAVGDQSSGGPGGVLPGPVGAYKDEVLADAPVVYLRLGEAGEVATDTAGKFLLARYQGGGIQRGVPGAIAGDSDPAVRLNGSTGWVGFGDAFDFTGRVPFSIELWVKPADPCIDPGRGLRMANVLESEEEAKAQRGGQGSRY